MTAPGTPALELSRIHKQFGTLLALSDASIRVRPGTIHALLGENGAGKSTLMRIAYGMTTADTGTIRVAGVPQQFASAGDAIAAGIGMVHQHFTLVPRMTVAENLALGGRGLLNASALRAQVEDLAHRTGFGLDAHARVETLTVGAQQRVEFAKAIARDPAVLILDEPTAVLTPVEVDDLLRWLRGFVATGHAVVLITHKLREAIAVSDDITVMRNGRVVLVAEAGAVTQDVLTTAMIGTSLEKPSARPRAPRADAPVILRASALCIAADDGRMLLKDADFTVRGGEIVGIAAIEGSGQQELLRVLAGRSEPAAGRLVRPTDVAYIPADRHRDAVMLDRDLAENVALRGSGTRTGLLHWVQRRTETRALMQEFDVRGGDATSPMRALSGGNQQKLVLARELTADASPSQLLVADNATRGLDVRAAAGIQTKIRQAAERGAAVVLYSNDIDEVLAMATRVMVIHNRALREVPPVHELVGRAMLGAD